MKVVDALAARLGLVEPRPFRGTAYRWVNPDFPLPPTGPAAKDCPTAGAYLEGGRMNAKGAQPPLYTALHGDVAALEVLRPAPPAGQNLEETAEEAAAYLRERGFRLFALELDLGRVLDLYRHRDLAERYLGSDWRGPAATCQGAHPTVPSQELGLAAFLAGYEAVLRPSVFVAEAWGLDAPVLDVFCPRLERPVRWTRVV
jgi:RES domain-containing protein